MKTNKLFATTLAFLISVSAFAQTAEEIVDKHIAALGGLDKLNSVKSMVVERSLSINGMDIPTKTTIVPGKSMRTESQVMGNSMIQVIDGESGWMVRPAMMGGTGEPEDMPAELLKQSLSQLYPFGSLVNYKEIGTKFELIGKEKVGKTDVYHLKVTSKEGQPSDVYLDANTFLVSKIKAVANGQEAEIEMSDYKDVQGIKVAHTMEMESQMGRLAFITNKVTVNGPIDETAFKKPKK